MNESSEMFAPDGGGDLDPSTRITSAKISGSARLTDSIDRIRGAFDGQLHLVAPPVLNPVESVAAIG